MIKIWLLFIALALIIFTSSYAKALNCTLYSDEHQDLCNVIEPLQIIESEKQELMQDNLYGSSSVNNGYVNLSLSGTNSSQTIEEIYNENIIFIGRFAIFLTFLYFFYKIIKSSFSKWLTVDY